MPLHPLLLFTVMLFSSSKLLTNNPADLYWTWVVKDKRVTSLFPVTSSDYILLVGQTLFWSPSCRFDSMITMLSNTSEIIWSYGFGDRPKRNVYDNEYTQFGYAYITSEGSIITGLSGKVHSTTSDFEPYFVKISGNSSGNMEYSKYIHCDSGCFTDLRYFYDMVLLEDDSYLITTWGKRAVTAWASRIQRISSNGTTVLLNQILLDTDTSRMLYPKRLFCGKNDVCYHTGIYDHVNYYTFIVKLSSDFSTVEWGRELDAGTNAVTPVGLVLDDGDLILALIFVNDVVVMRIKSNGSRDWKKILSIQFGTGIVAMNNMQMLDDGTIQFRVFDDLNDFFIRITTSGELVEHFRFSGTTSPHLIQIKDGSSQFLLASHPSSTENHFSRFDKSAGIACPGINIISNYTTVTLDTNNGLWNTFSDWTNFHYYLSDQSFSMLDVPVNRLEFTAKELEETHERVCYNSKYFCYNVTRVNETFSCSGHGECVSGNNCSCTQDYSSDDCSRWKCFGYEWDHENVCSARNGSCVATDKCECQNNYFGPKCELWSCDGVLYNDTDNVCRNHGVCASPDKCVCETNYQASIFCDWKCGGHLHDYYQACVQRGKCVGYNNCSCNTGYSGTDCEHHSCFGVHQGDTRNVCGGHGQCITLDTCMCEMGYSSSGAAVDRVCDQWYCGAFFKNDSEVCNGVGNCTSHWSCGCEDGYLGDLCDEWDCGVYSNTDRLGCNGHGECKSPHFCDCDSGYSGSLCGDWKCGSIYRNETSLVCESHGTCVSANECKCNDGFWGIVCETWTCGLYSHNDSSACSGRGVCKLPNVCECSKGYYGTTCGDHDCFSISFLRESEVCSGNGVCEKPDECSCDAGYAGDDCSTNMYLLTIMTPVLATTGTVFIAFVILLIILFSCLVLVVTVCTLICCGVCLCCCGCCVVCCLVSCFGGISARQFGKLKKFGKLKNLDMLLEEQAAEDDDSIAHIKITKDLFEIDIAEVKVESILGEGGSNSVVYRAKWKNQIVVAFKCFRTRSICSSQDKFNEFEKEVNILSSISHPSIVRFFGCTLNPPRVGILMEFCCNGEVHHFISKYRKKKNKAYPFSEKLRCLKEIASAMEYLHSRNIIHRDLKPENVLVNQTENCKVMDFGVSKLSKESTQQTKRVGTSFFMAPEVVKRDDYGESCDVFSYGILIFALVTEETNPYVGVADNVFGIELRVANDQDFRPDWKQSELMKSEDFKDGEDMRWLKELASQCWHHDPSCRPSFDRVIHLIDTRQSAEEEDDEEAEEGKSSEESEESSGDVDDRKDDYEKRINKLEKVVHALEEENQGLRRRLLENDE